MSETGGFRWERALLGAAGLGILSVVLLPASGLLPAFTMALALIAAVAGSAWWAYRRGQREIALGLLVGYGVLSLVSGGQCTMLAGEGSLEETPNLLTGLLVYPVLLAASLVITLIVSAITRSRSSQEEEK